MIVSAKGKNVHLILDFAREGGVFHTEHDPHPSSDEPCGLRHFALSISPGCTLEDEIERLKESTNKVLDFSSIMTDWTGVRFVFTKDPDGTVVEIRE